MNNETQPSTTPSAPLPSKEGAGKGPRMEWIDAMRGLTMLLVVAYHVSVFGYGESIKSSLYLNTCLLFRMPLFFFISGFFSYSTKIKWDTPTLGRMIWKKSRIQMLPTIIFFTLYVIVSRRDFVEGAIGYLHNPTKGGYWFTYILLVMFVVYYLYAYLERWLPRKSIFMLWFVSLVGYATWFMPAWFNYPQSEFMQWSSFGQLIQYFHFFLAGNIARRYWPQVQRIFDTKWFFPALITLAIVCLCEIFTWHNLHLQWANLPRTLCMYSLLTTVVVVFRYYSEFFSKKTIVGRTLQYIGMRTLDIYLIHFFFLPAMPFVGQWLASLGIPFVIDVTLSFAGAAVVILFSVTASNIIRTSPLLKYYLFGRK